MAWGPQTAGQASRRGNRERTKGSVRTADLSITLLLLVAALTSACSQPPSTPPAPVLIRLSGSTSMQPLLQELAAAYSERHTYVSFDVTAVGSAAGIEELRRGNADLALLSRELRPDEEFDPQTRERLLAYTVIAQDAIAVVVNENNPVRGLTLYQVRNIFDGQFTTWDQVGGPAEEIVVISREDGSGTRDVFEEVAMYGRRMTPTALIMPGSEAVLDYASAHESAVGYLSLGYLGPGIDAVTIDGVSPTREAVEGGSYLIARPFLLVSRAEPDVDLAEFMQFARSPAGQAIVRRIYGGARAGPQ